MIASEMHEIKQRLISLALIQPTISFSLYDINKEMKLLQTSKVINLFLSHRITLICNRLNLVYHLLFNSLVLP